MGFKESYNALTPRGKHAHTSFMTDFTRSFPISNHYDLLLPDFHGPIVFDSPHSGRHYPDDFDHICSRHDLEKLEDRFVDLLIKDAVDHNIPVLCQKTARSYIDINREIDDIDPYLLRDTWFGPANPTRQSMTGIGLIFRRCGNNKPIYIRKLSAKEMKRRIDNHYTPYRLTLKALLDHAYQIHKQSYYLSWHSMPSTHADGTPMPDIVLGDQNGTTCTSDITNMIKDFLEQCGYKVGLNHIYKGGALVQKNATPQRNQHAIQIEINRAIYMDEHTLEKIDAFNDLKDSINRLIKELSQHTENQNNWPQAAD